MSPPSPKTGYDFGTIVVIANPTSKHASVANVRISKLEKLYPGQVRIVKVDPDILVTRRNLLDTLAQEVGNGNRPVLAIAGGDGTVNLVLQTLVSPAVPDHVRTVPIVPLGTGNANDVAFMLYDDPSHIETLFARGHAIDIRPLECYITPPGGLPERHVAAGYIGFGFSAHSAHALNKPEIRHHPDIEKWYGELIPDVAAIRAALQAPTFRINQQGAILRLREILIGNGERVAKFGKMPARLDKPEIYITTVRDSWIGRSAVPLNAVKMILGNMPGELVKERSFSCMALDTVAAQFDGEPIYVRSGSHIRIGHAKTTFRALATKLPIENNH